MLWKLISFTSIDVNENSLPLSLNTFKLLSKLYLWLLHTFFQIQKYIRLYRGFSGHKVRRPINQPLAALCSGYILVPMKNVPSVFIVRLLPRVFYEKQEYIMICYFYTRNRYWCRCSQTKESQTKFLTWSCDKFARGNYVVMKIKHRKI